MGLEAAAPAINLRASGCNFLVLLIMEPTEEQLTALGNYRDIIIQHVPEIAEAIGVSPQTLTGWMEDKGDPTSEQAEKILEFLTKKAKTR
jgi:transcriptional regulator with XRE-family HTH domain